MHNVHALKILNELQKMLITKKRKKKKKHQQQYQMCTALHHLDSLDVNT